VEDTVDAIDRPPQADIIRKVALEALDLDVPQELERARPADQRSDAVSGFDKHARQMASGKSGRAGDQNFQHHLRAASGYVISGSGLD